MKKHLLGTTALVAAGMFAMADTAAAQTKVGPVQVSVGGYYAEYVSYTSQDDRGATTGPGSVSTTTGAFTPGQNFGSSGKLTEFDQWSDKEIHFNGRTTLDNGLTVGFRVEMEANTDSSDQIDELFMFVESTFGRLELGAINAVNYRMGYNAPEAQTRAWSNEGNITNVFANTTGSPFGDTMLGTTRSRFFDNDSEKINYYTPRFIGFQLGASYIPNSSQDRNGAPDPISTGYSSGYSFAANFVRTFGAFDIAASAGYQAWQGPQTSATTTAPDPDQWNVGLQLGFAGFKIGASYGEISDGRTGSSGTASTLSTAGTGGNKVEGRAYDAGIMYTFGPAAVSLNYISGENDDCPVAGSATCSGDDTFSMLSLGGKYTLGPGVSLEANIWTAKFEGNTTTTSTDDNDGTGGIVGIVLVIRRNQVVKTSKGAASAAPFFLCVHSLPAAFSGRARTSLATSGGTLPRRAGKLPGRPAAANPHPLRSPAAGRRGAPDRQPAQRPWRHSPRPFPDQLACADLPQKDRTHSCGMAVAEQRDHRHPHPQRLAAWSWCRCRGTGRGRCRPRCRRPGAAVTSGMPRAQLDALRRHVRSRKRRCSRRRAIGSEQRPGAQQQPGVGQCSQQLRPAARASPATSLAALLNEPKVTEPRASEGGGATSGALRRRRVAAGSRAAAGHSRSTAGPRHPADRRSRRPCASRPPAGRWCRDSRARSPAPAPAAGRRRRSRLPAVWPAESTRMSIASSRIRRATTSSRSPEVGRQRSTRAFDRSVTPSLRFSSA